MTDTQKQIRIDGGFLEYLVDTCTRTAQRLGKPCSRMMLSYQFHSDKLTNMHNTILFMAGEFPGPVVYNPSLYLYRKAWEPFPAFNLK